MVLLLGPVLAPVALGGERGAVDRTAATGDPEATSAATSERVAVYAAANAARARVDAGESAGLDAELEAIAVRVDGLASPADQAHVLIHLARTWVRLGDARAASADAATTPERVHAAALFREAAIRADRARDPRLAAYGWGYLAGLYLDAGRLDEARRGTRQALVDARQAGAPDATYRFLAQLGRIERRAGDRDAAIAAYRRAVEVIGDVGADLAVGSLDAAFAFRGEVEPVYTALVDLLLARAEELDADTAQPWLREARDALESLKSAELRNHLGDDCLAAQRRVAPDDLPGAAVLYPVVLEDRVELIVGRDGALSLHRSPLAPADLDARARAMRREVASPITRRYLRPAADLHAALIAPIAPRLEGASVLVVVAGGVLRTIPFTALYDAGSRRHLVERIAVVVSPGLTLTEPKPFPGARAHVLAAGIAQARQGFSALPAVPDELHDIAETFATTELLDDAFEAARFDGEIEHRAVGVVHVATHGEFNARSSESFVVTWDRRLPMDEFAATIARTARRNEAPLELLVLSACETAAGDERAALGLAGIAVQSGARSAVATLWSVNDRATRQLIQRFYAELAAGRSRAEALRAAQLALLGDDTFSHPAFWSPFLLVGSWL